MILCWFKPWTRGLSGLLFSKKLIIHDQPTGCLAKQKDVKSKKNPGSLAASLICAVPETLYLYSFFLCISATVGVREV